VRGVTASDGPLQVYCGYDNAGNPLSGNTYCNTPELYDSCAALDKCMDASIAINPKRMRVTKDGKVLHMGAYNGVMTVRNYLTGGIMALDRAIDNYGNPYFDECSQDQSWTAGTEVNEKERGIQ